MNSLIVSFFTSLIINLITIKSNRIHDKFSNDTNLVGPQKFHLNPVPRIGGFSIFLSLATTGIYTYQSTNNADNLLLLLMLCATPAFFIGFTEDITKKLGAKVRLLAISTSPLIGCALLSCYITKTQIYGIDWLLGLPFISLTFTIFAITGLTNSYNLIDGFNGLSSMVGIITISSISFIAYCVSDFDLCMVSLTIILSILGFLIWNFPGGLIFLGDGGAYLIGYITASLSILLINRNAEISPWFALLVNIYPVFETIFTIWRRKFSQGKNAFSPDGIHLHSLIFRRLTRKNNAKTAPYLWLLSLTAIIPAIIFYKTTWILQLFSLLFCATYIWIYKSIVNFKFKRICQT